MRSEETALGCYPDQGPGAEVTGLEPARAFKPASVFETDCFPFASLPSARGRSAFASVYCQRRTEPGPASALGRRLTSHRSMSAHADCPLAEDTGLEPARLLHRPHFPGGALSIRISSKTLPGPPSAASRTGQGSPYHPQTTSGQRRTWDSNPHRLAPLAVFKTARFPFAYPPWRAIDAQ
jgi:hypothetical protein